MAWRPPKERVNPDFEQNTFNHLVRIELEVLSLAAGNTSWLKRAFVVLRVTRTFQEVASGVDPIIGLRPAVVAEGQIGDQYGHCDFREKWRFAETNLDSCQ